MVKENKEENVALKPEKKQEKKPKKAKIITVKANKKGRHIQPFLNFLRVLLIPPFWLLKPFRFYGNRKVADGACVYICNHYTMFDALYPAVTTWESVHFIAKRENFETPIIGWIFRNIKAICANRDGNDVRTMLDSIKCLKNGEKIIIFPEGTRNKTDADMLPFHHGAALMAIKTKTPIIPMMLYKKPRWFRMAHILIGDPLEMTEYYDRKLSAEEILEADEKLRQHLLNMRKEHTEFLASKKAKNKKA